GGIRGDLKDGPVTRYDVVSALPFINTAMETTMTGAQVRKVLEQSLTLEAGVGQTAGLRGSDDLSRPAKKRVNSIEVGGKPLDDSKSYKVVASSFIATGGDNYSAFLEGKNTHDTGTLLSDVLVDYLKSKGVLKAPEPTRMIASGAHK